MMKQTRLIIYTLRYIYIYISVYTNQELAITYHPDKRYLNPNKYNNYKEKFLEFNSIKNKFSDPGFKQKYDRTLRQQLNETDTSRHSEPQPSTSGTQQSKSNSNSLVVLSYWYH